MRPGSAELSVPRWLLIAGLGSLLFRGWLAVALPITGDEAYFYWWGVYPDWGYYDHPPMVGWLIAAMRALLSDTLWAIRLPVVLLPAAIGALLWWALAAVDRTRAAWAVLLFWLAPINWLNVLITTDTPLIFWSVASACCLLIAERRPRLDGRAWGLYALSGLLLGAAFLSKYFSVVLGLAYFAYFVLFRRDRFAAFAVLVLCALPGPAINIAWNIEHCWSNIMFNLINRNAGEVFTWKKPVTYLAMMVYLVSPVAAWLSWKHRDSLGATFRSHRLLGCLVVVPLLFFALLSYKKVIGLHWVMSFYPFGFAFIAFGLPAQRLRACAIGLAVLTGLHVIAVVGVAMTPLERWQLISLYKSIVRTVKTAEMLKQVDAPGVVLMANAYTPASTYAYALRRYVPVFGVGKFHARQDDLLVDYRTYQGQTIRIVRTDRPKLEEYSPYFDTVELLTFQQSGITFYAVEGKGFRYQAYRDGPLTDVLNRYYRIPEALPLAACAYCERVCGKARCPVSAPGSADKSDAEGDGP
jgi:4-amino-4-deoxy-L-arabinose transferase-like glycosyltransferase